MLTSTLEGRAGVSGPSISRSRLLMICAAGLLLAGFLMQGVLPAALYDWPERWVLPLQEAATDWLTYILRRSDIGGRPLIAWTREFSAYVNIPLEFLQSLLTKGWLIPGATAAETLRIPSLSWLSVTGVAVFLTYGASGRGLAILTAATLAYFAVFGLWEDAMLTVASVAFIVVVGFAIGLALGTLIWRHPRLETVFSPIFDVMQTLPIFSYLVPVVLLVGFGPLSAVIVTLVFSLPPMARATVLALRQVPPEIRELGDMTGASQGQYILKMLIPSAKTGLMIGLNQLIMTTLAMVILASMIGAGGLGGEVLQSLQILRFGRGLESGLAITLLAIVLYRYGSALAHRRPRHDATSTLGRDLAIVGALIALPSLAGLLWPVAQRYPEALTITSEPLWSGAIDFVNLHSGEKLEALRVFLSLNLLIPLRGAIMGMGWASVALALCLVGWAASGPRLAIASAAVIAIIAATGYWERAVITVHLVLVGVLLGIAIGVPFGIWSALSRRAKSVIDVAVDLIQTLPSLVYLVPIVMLLGPGDVSAVLAIAAYVVGAVIRYCDHALRSAPDSLIEAVRSTGATEAQVFRIVRLPFAVPGLLLGLNQAIMLGISMVVVTALVGTRGLEQETITALARVDPGRGLVAGAMVCLIAITIDRLLAAVARKASTVPAAPTH
ncbi:ABC transporter permease [Sagittula stellata]|nr:ABC transporter permease subunit [Sagittula stellata]